MTHPTPTPNSHEFGDFDFMAEPKEPETPLDQPEDGPEWGKIPKMNNKKFAQSVLDTFEALGGADWLLIQAKVDPKTFLGMLAKMIPKSIDAEDLQGLTLMIVDQYVQGDQKVLLHQDRSPALPASAASAAGGGPSELGQPSSVFPSGSRSEQTATSGNPLASAGGQPMPSGSKSTMPSLDVINVFE